MITISSLLFLLWSLLNCAIYVYFFKEKFGRLITISFIGYTLLSYLFGVIFKNILFVPLIISTLLVIYVFIKLSKNKEEWTNFKKNYFSVGLIMYVAIFVVLIVFQRNKTLGHVDDYMHWGLFIKDILNYNSYSAMINNPFAWFHSDYPPFMQTFESIFMYICHQGFVEWYGLMAISLFSLSTLIFPVEAIESVSKKTNYKLFTYLVIVILSGLFLNNTTSKGIALFYQTLVVDGSISFLLAFSLYNVCERRYESKKDYIIFSMVMSSLVLTKQISICFFLLIIFALSVKLVIEKKLFNNWKNIILIIAIPIIFFVSWELIVDYYNQSGQFLVEDISIKQFIDIADGKGGLEWQRVTLSNYIDALIHKNLHNGIVNMNYPMLIILSIICVITLFILTKEITSNFISVVSTYIVGAIGYAVVMMLSYVFLFNSSEGPVLAEFERYMQIYIVFCFLYIVLIFAKYLFKDEIKTNVSVVFITTLIIFFQTDFSTIHSLFESREYITNDLGYQLNDYLIQTSSDEKLLIFEQYVTDFNHQYKTNVYLRYKTSVLFDRPYQEKFKFISVAPKGEWKEKFLDLVLVKNIKEFEDLLKGYDFIYIENSDDYLIELFNQITNEYFLTERLYRVIKKDGSIDLILIDHINTIENTRQLGEVNYND